MTEKSAPSLTRVILLRHGETAAPDLFHGSESDIGLGPRGRVQAEQAAAEIAAIKPSAVYCSGMRRARETAEPIARAVGCDLGFEPELRERRMGPLSGFSRVEGWPQYDEAKAQWMAGNLDFTHEGGESYVEIRDRVVPALQRLAEKHRGETIVIVGHGVANRVLIASVVQGLSPANFDEITIEFVKQTELLYDGSAWTWKPAES